ncbi:hypothetical protein ACIRS1_08630 [Kitasatospora sp. NPDC101176]|uniref:hypothetical protein n=1 Tax=Kitasatospora sp. NPDC101176 TaxID=3364099 RepID=UPI0037F79C44
MPNQPGSRKGAPARTTRFADRTRRALVATGTWLETPEGRAAFQVAKTLLSLLSIGAGHHMG